MSKHHSKCTTCRHPCATDEDARFEISEDFRRFNQREDIFSRSFWDSTIRSKDTDKFYQSYRLPLEEWRHVDGYHQKDFALRNAGWHVADFFAERLLHEDRREGFLDYLTAHREGASEQREIRDPEEMSREIKKVAKLMGADLTGITYYDERWVYSHKYNRATEGEAPMDLPEGMTSVIVVVHEMDHDLLKTVPSALSGTATGVGYSKDAVTLLALAQYIRNLGYRAYASMNDTAASIPYAIKAGLGEYGRHGLLITEELGPRLRIGKVFTDLPLGHDRPKRFGVKEFCNTCRRCKRGVSPSGDYLGRPIEADIQPIQHPRRQEVDHRRRKMLQLLGEASHRLFHLLESLSLQPGLPALGEQDPLPTHGVVSETTHALAGYALGRRRAACAEMVVEQARLVERVVSKNTNEL